MFYVGFISFQRTSLILSKVESLIKHENRSKMGQMATSNAQATTRGLCVS